MRAWLLGLAITAATFAGTTVYLARELAMERERGPHVAGAPAEGRDHPPGVSARTVAAAPVTLAPQTPRDPTGSAGGFAASAGPMTEGEIRRAQAEYSNRFLSQIADPLQREEMLAERKMQMRNMFPRLEQVLGLTPDQYSRFLELQARQQLEMQEASAKCMVDPACDFREQRWEPHEFGGDEIASLLGPDGMQKFETYKNTMGEREAVSQLKARLPDSQRLSEERAEQLITALAQEREALNQEAYRNGRGVTGFGIGAGMVFAPDESVPFEERYESARRYSQRLRDRAAQYLNAEQARHFNEMQEDTLISLRGALRNKHNGSGGYTAVTITSPDPASSQAE